jgi:hypothetical protein
MVVIHPTDGHRGETGKKGSVIIQPCQGSAVNRRNGACLPTQALGHGGAAGTYCQNRNTHVKNCWIHSLLGIRVAGKDDAQRLSGPQFFDCGIGGINLTEYMALPNSPGDELIIFPTETQDQNFLHENTSASYRLPIIMPFFG